MTELHCGRGRCLKRTLESNAAGQRANAATFTLQAQSASARTRQYYMDAAQRAGLKIASHERAARTIEETGVCNGCGGCGTIVKVA